MGGVPAGSGAVGGDGVGVRPGWAAAGVPSGVRLRIAVRLKSSPVLCRCPTRRQLAQTSASSAGTVVARASSLRAATVLFGSMPVKAGS